MGLDYHTIDLSDYLEALEANNEAHSEGKADVDPARADKLAKVMAAHGDGGKT
ncbi:hypothetical protein [Allopontixanthobacter sediminis]|uniref:Uncharacterized protein n=1 Tax=Allopontixanthobacter sediminis TaxID=1689985 RepID=A0A845AXL3_9SPHN|nr:hypothetical protein [Allopontixanthobacter sediminis]MXP42990.1 hypothetical protein [Allopontixanthobacter sediminis]